MDGTKAPSGSNVGGLVGAEAGGSIMDDYVDGTVKGASRGHNGGLVGYQMKGSSIQNSHSSAAVTGGDYSQNGGLAGLQSGSITDSYAIGSVAGGKKSYTGGLIGYQYMGGSVTNSFAADSVTGGISADVGGIAGVQGSGSVTNTYARGKLTGATGAYLGGITGFQNTSLDPTKDSFFDQQTTGQTQGAGNLKTTPGVTGELTKDMQLSKTFTGWASSGVWSLVDGQYPLLQWQVPLNFAVSSATPTTVVAGNPIKVTGQVKDATGVPFDAVTISLSGAGGSATAATNTSGIFSGSVAPTQAGSANLKAVLSGYKTTTIIPITVKPGVVSKVTLQSSAMTLLPGSKTSFTGRVTDMFGNPIPGQMVHIASTGGTVSGKTFTTDAKGEFSGSFTASANSGTANLTATVSENNTTKEAKEVLTVLGTPAGLAHANVTQTGWREHWNPVIGATSYVVYLNGTKMVTVATPAYTFIGEKAGTTYAVKVTALSKSGVVSGSASDSVTTVSPSPAPSPTPNPNPNPQPSPNPSHSPNPEPSQSPAPSTTSPVPDATSPVTGFASLYWALAGLLSMLTGISVLYWQRRRQDSK
ncbi:carboxypeptidase regulatory-like domain-containing protein [Alicyclobacillus sp. SO9]|uniref:Ig-like domain-containing protein n=1 Tax=Alicyclobacillus sp. SO9 TaxID=2665646 RepID=UPI0018E73DB3|nr:carboxypeptidase regulatory-like domain-containing protein [Alicyclobacillus sp. SO9]QQE78922.1 carboxypeptidase regulatory-like domain-containing protein [Alicyclobacillus sp. SO9]